jgi:hypothetical protein
LATPWGTQGYQPWIPTCSDPHNFFDDFGMWASAFEWA